VHILVVEDTLEVGNLVVVGGILVEGGSLVVEDNPVVVGVADNLAEAVEDIPVVGGPVVDIPVVGEPVEDILVVVVLVEGTPVVVPVEVSVEDILGQGSCLVGLARDSCLVGLVQGVVEEDIQAVAVPHKVEGDQHRLVEEGSTEVVKGEEHYQEHQRQPFQLQ